MNHITYNVQTPAGVTVRSFQEERSALTFAQYEVIQGRYPKLEVVERSTIETIRPIKTYEARKVTSDDIEADIFTQSINKAV